jgi:virginiamycin B lyase
MTHALRWVRALSVAVLVGALVAGAAGSAPRSPLDAPSAIASGPDGRVWVADSTGIVVATTRGRMARAATIAGVTSIVRGPDGAMWFGAHSPARIGRITTAGDVTYFTAGIGGVPHWIARGADGNLWFTENAAGTAKTTAIARITPAGQVSEFSQGLMTTHADQAFLDHITAGPDGNMWFTDGLRAVGRITPAGVITEFPLRQSFNDYREAIGIAAGADRALWFGYGDRIGRITTGGHLSYYKDPFDEVDDLVRGRDGNIWFTQANGYYDATVTVGRITPKGRVTILGRGLTGVDPGGITVGPDGDIWLAEGGRTGDHVARIQRGSATEFPRPLPCRVPHLKRLPLVDVRDRLFNALCGIEPASVRAGRHAGTVALSVRPRPGTILPYGSELGIRFGPLPPLPKRCALPFAARRLAQTRRVLVFAYTDWAEHEESTTTYGACLRPHGPLRILARSIDELLQYSSASAFQVAGPDVAYAFFYEDHYNEGSDEVRVVDVRTGARLATWTQSWDPFCGRTDVISLALTHAGSAAWTDSLDERGDCRGELTYQVWKVEVHGRPQLLDGGTGVDPHSLRLRGHTVTWSDAGTQRSATLR